MTKKVPIILIIFNRPDLTQKVIESISTYKPEVLYVVADGPRDKGDAQACQQTRNLIDHIDWMCTIHKNYSQTNIGCGLRIYSGISWAFETCDRAIILEDDCIPHPSFFPYCEELLEMYSSNERIGLISGNCFIEQKGMLESYFFSNISNIWGWATWKRTWDQFDINMVGWSDLRRTNFLKKKTGSEFWANNWKTLLDSVYLGSRDIWDYQFTFNIWKNNQLCIMPKHNLVTNIGFDSRATHTTTPSLEFSYLPAKKIEFPLVHPLQVKRDKMYDRKYFRKYFGPTPSIIQRIRHSVKELIHKIFLLFKKIINQRK